MEHLPTDPDAYPDGIETVAVDCPDCGTTGYMAAEQRGHLGPHDALTPSCKACYVDDIRQHLDPDADTWLSRADALDRLDTHDLLPVRDHNGALIVSVDVDHGPPGTSSYVSGITTIHDRDCPECGHDRVNHTYWAAYTCESGTRTVCRACGHVLEEESTL